MQDIIIVLVLVLIIGSAARYVYRAKKHGEMKCIGCPAGGSCSGKSDCCSCNQE